MKSIRTIFVSSLVLACALTAAAKTKEEKQAELRKKAQDTLARLYKARPSARAAIKRAAGYAVFNSKGVKILVAGGGKGQGIAVDNATQKVTYMKMREVQAGLGMGAKKFSTIFVFETKAALEKFINSGWEFGGQTTAAAKTGSGGGSYEGAASVSEGVWMYQLTDKGLALELTGKGTKYSKDDDLN
ncbi:MAG TPA: YSC84-related protein [Pyrinomonadaceae bacterium]|nr:YSC84-related protein [Pyrinomonadaceae bacterium]